MYYGNRGSMERRAAVAPTSRGLSREEARLLIRAELKRAGISEKITRYVSRMAETSYVLLFFLLCRLFGSFTESSFDVCETEKEELEPELEWCVGLGCTRRS